MGDESPVVGAPVVVDPRYHDGVLFDLDGIITDTAALHAAAWTQMFDDFLTRRTPDGHEDHSAFTLSDYRRFVDGKPRHDGIRDFLAARGITLPFGEPSDSGSADGPDTVCGLGNRKQALFTGRIAGGVPVFASTVALVRRLIDTGVPVAVFSASRNCEAVLESAGISALFGVRVDGVVAEELGLPGKPDPALLLETARRLGVRPGRTVVIEDSEAGVTAARAGGFGLVVAVDRGGDDRARLAGCGADAVIGDCAEVTVRSIDRRMSTLPDALRCFGQIAGVAAARRPAVFFDFDGTLSEIVDQPGAAVLVPGAEAALRALAALSPTAVLSGRGLDDIVARVGIPGLWYAGSHGFEVVAPDGSYHSNETAAQAIPLLTEAAEELTERLASLPGVMVEHKRFAVAVHYRNAEPGADVAVTAAVHEIGNRSGLKVTAGRMVVELRPNVDWDKGRTLEWILQLSRDRADGHEPLLPIFLGDDLTDEDAFDAVLHDGIGIVVRHTEDGDRATAARYALDSPDQVREFIDRLVAQCDIDRQILSSPWSFTYGGYLPDQERLREALCAVGNGYRVTRGCAPESDAGPSHYPGTYAAGLYNRLSDDVGGVVIENESLVNLPNWLSLKFRIDGDDWFDIDDCEVLSYRQSMDLRRAELTREFRFRDNAGRTTKVLQRRFAALHVPHAGALETTVWAEDWSGAVEFASVIDGDVRNSGVERYRALSDDHLVATTTRELSENSCLLVCETVQSRIPIAVAARTTLWRGGSPLPAEGRFIDGGRRAGHDVVVTLAPGESVTVEKMAAIFTGRDHAISEPGDAAATLLNQLGRYADLREGHVREWAHLWERFDIAFGDGASGDSTDALRVVRLHLLHLLQSVPHRAEDLDAGLPARGLHGEAYRGHVFWDELFVFPVLNLRSPANTRSLLRYRYRRLPQARRAAREAGYAGAMFPWQSGSDGREESQKTHLNPNSGRWNPDASARAHHIGIAVAYNVWQYYQVTGDLEYLIENGAEMLAEIARFWVSRAEFDQTRQRYVIRGVIGPDEFHSGYPDAPYDGIDNNAYTNVMAVWVIIRALDAMDALPLRERLDLLERLGIRGRDLDRWDDVSRRMFVPFHPSPTGEQVISQFEGYADLAELDWEGLRRRYGNIQRLDRILEADNDSVTRYQASKQADALMLFYLLSADELRELFARLRYRFTPDQIPATVDYYLKRTSHGSTLSGVVHAWVLARGNRDRAMRYFQQVLMSDVADIQGGTTAEGIHIAAMAGSVDLLQRCFTGLETREDRLIVNPMWPETLGALRMPIHYRGHRLHLTIVGRTADISVDPAELPPITVECRGQVVTLAPGTSLRFG